MKSGWLPPIITTITLLLLLLYKGSDMCQVLNEWKKIIVVTFDVMYDVSKLLNNWAIFADEDHVMQWKNWFTSVLRNSVAHIKTSKKIQWIIQKMYFDT